MTRIPALLGAVALGVLAAVPTAAQTPRIEQQTFDALLKYCIATRGVTDRAVELAEADGWQPSVGAQGGNAAMFRMRAGPEPLILAVELKPGSGAQQPAHICTIQAQRGDVATAGRLVRQWLPGLDEFMPSSEGRLLFAYFDEPTGARPVPSSLTDAELAAQSDRMSVLVVDGTRGMFKISLMAPLQPMSR